MSLAEYHKSSYSSSPRIEAVCGTIQFFLSEFPGI